MMKNDISFLIPVIFLSICALLALIGIFKPEKTVNLTAKYFKWSAKLYGFEVEIKPTPRAKTICRIWNLFMLLVFFVFAILVIITTK